MTIYGAILTEEQAKELTGLEYSDGCMFNPVQDSDGSWFITEDEIFGCANEDLRWVRRLNITEINNTNNEA
tara:strand:- start:3453 stop:3665 length:213 start_codon:yes stop_codon:yes gene_type:complete